MLQRLTRSVPLALALLGAAALTAAGCNKSKPTEPGPEAMNGPGGPGGPGPSSAEVFAKLPGGEEYAAGKHVYANNGCARCHKLGETGGGPPGMPGMPGMAGGPPSGPGGPGGPPGEGAGGGKGFGGGKGPRGGMNGPDLTAVGADPAHTKEWLAAHVRDPKSHKPQSRMPASGPDKIPDPDLDALAAYLASRK